MIRNHPRVARRSLLHIAIVSAVGLYALWGVADERSASSAWFLVAVVSGYLGAGFAFSWRRARRVQRRVHEEDPGR